MPSDQNLTVPARIGLTVLLAIYGTTIIVDPGRFPLIDNVNLAIHETGHLVFGFLGEFIRYLGGTIMQLLVPAAFVVHFARRGDRYGASTMVWWVGQNCWNISVYVKDARAQVLPLLGGGEHDWAYLLSRIGLLQQDQAVGNFIFFVGIVLFVASIGLGFMNVTDRT